MSKRSPFKKQIPKKGQKTLKETTPAYDFSSFSAVLSRGVEALDIGNVSPEIYKHLFVYFTHLKKWMPTINLVAAAPDPQLVENHFLDSLSPLPLLGTYDQKTPASLIDIGSGAGFPGLILKIACPNLRVTLLEPRLKRVSFLKQIIRTLSLKDVFVVSERLGLNDPEFIKNHGKFSIVTCRALSELDSFLPMAEQICLPKGEIICMKGPKVDREIHTWQKKYPESLLSKVKEHRFFLPHSGAERALVVFKKPNC